MWEFERGFFILGLGTPQGRRGGSETLCVVVWCVGGGGTWGMAGEKKKEIACHYFYYSDVYLV